MKIFPLCGTLQVDEDDDQTTNPDNQTATPVNTRRKRSAVHFENVWPPHSTLRIQFVSDTPKTLMEPIINAINQWQPFINLKLEFYTLHDIVPGDAVADIRITTDTEKNSSAIGTKARQVPPDRPTMYLGMRPESPYFQALVMHEFGHALGLQHEHQRRDAHIPWDYTKVYAFYKKHGFNKNFVDKQMLETFPVISSTPYDPLSIMHYPVYNETTVGDFEIPYNFEISEHDKALVGTYYYVG